MSALLFTLRRINPLATAPSERTPPRRIEFKSIRSTAMKLYTLMACTLSLIAWHTPELATAQQDKMSTCNKTAATKNLSGDARKTFMSECLKAK